MAMPSGRQWEEGGMEGCIGDCSKCVVRNFTCLSVSMSVSIKRRKQFEY